MSRFNDRGDEKNPMSKKKKVDMNEQIERLTDFYNALSDDTNMSYIIDKLDEMHDLHVDIQTQITLLSDELNAFEIKFDEKIDYSDSSIENIRSNAINTIENAVVQNIALDVEVVKKLITRAKNSSLEEINTIFIDAKDKVRKNNSVVIDMKIQKNKFNFEGYATLFISSMILMLGFYYLISTAHSNKEINSYIVKQQQNVQSINYLKKESDDRFELIKGALLDLSEKR